MNFEFNNLDLISAVLDLVPCGTKWSYLTHVTASHGSPVTFDITSVQVVNPEFVSHSGNSPFHTYST